MNEKWPPGQHLRPLCRMACTRRTRAWNPGTGPAVRLSDRAPDRSVAPAHWPSTRNGSPQRQLAHAVRSRSRRGTDVAYRRPHMSAISLALREGLAAAQNQQFDRARVCLEQATIETPENPIAWFWLAIVSPSAGTAIPCLRRVLALDAGHEQARAALAKLLVAEAQALAGAGRRDEARALATEATETTPDAVGVWLSLVAVTENQIGRIDALRQAAVRAPDDQRIRTKLRQALLARAVMTATADRAEARVRFREAATLEPGDACVWEALVNLADTRGEWLSALCDLIRVAPGHPTARTTLRDALAVDAQALTATGRVDAACDRWREAIEVTGGDVDTWLGLAAITPDAGEA